MTELKLSARFMRRHMRQQLAAVLTIALFSTAILAMLFLAQCFKASNYQLAYDYYGNFSGETMFANPAKVAALGQTLSKEGAGIISVKARVSSAHGAGAVYIGYMDANARSLRAVRVKEGAFPHRR